MNIKLLFLCPLVLAIFSCGCANKASDSSKVNDSDSLTEVMAPDESTSDTATEVTPETTEPETVAEPVKQVPLTVSDIAIGYSDDSVGMHMGRFMLKSKTLKSKGFKRSGNNWERIDGTNDIKIKLTNPENPSDLIGYGLTVTITFSNPEDLKAFTRTFSAAGFEKMGGNSYATGAFDEDISAVVKNNSVTFE